MGSGLLARRLDGAAQAAVPGLPGLCRLPPASLQQGALLLAHREDREPDGGEGEPLRLSALRRLELRREQRGSALLCVLGACLGAEAELSPGFGSSAIAFSPLLVTGFCCFAPLR